MIPTSLSEDPEYIFAVWGVTGDVPAVADFDGDGASDLSVYSAFSTQEGLAQVFGTSLYGGYWGVDSKVYTPNPSVPDGDWVAAPVGISKLYDAYYGYGFVEAGPIKWCETGCSLHPYTSYRDTNGNGDFWMDESVTLLAGGLYRYRAYYLSGYSWQADFCDAGGCSALGTWNLMTDRLPYVAVGGESISKDVKWGDIDNRENRYRPYGGTYSYWCYGDSYVGQPGGGISACNWSIYGWTVSYR
jgi:hypothetical protein